MPKNDPPKFTSQSPRSWLPGMRSGDTVGRYLNDPPKPDPKPERSGTAPPRSKA